jgi:hypothetical protein
MVRVINPSLSAKNVPALSIHARLSPTFCGAFSGCRRTIEPAIMGDVLMPKAPLFFHHFGVPIGGVHLELGGMACVKGMRDQAART